MVIGGNSPFLKATTALQSSKFNPFFSLLQSIQASTRLDALSDPFLHLGTTWSVVVFDLPRIAPQYQHFTLSDSFRLDTQCSPIPHLQSHLHL